MTDVEWAIAAARLDRRRTWAEIVEQRELDRVRREQDRDLRELDRVRREWERPIEEAIEQRRRRA